MRCRDLRSSLCRWIALTRSRAIFSLQPPAGSSLSLASSLAPSPLVAYSQKRVVELKSHRVTPALTEASASASQGESRQTQSDRQRLVELQDRIDDLEEELANSVGLLKDATSLDETKTKEIKALNESLSEARGSIRSLEVELDALKARHAESVRLAESYIAEARLSRDEEVARLEQRIDEVRRAGEEQVDAAKAITSELRQENEVLKSTAKKMEQAKRDAERETQRAINKFEAAVQSLEQLEHQYSLLDRDAKETEAAKTERILALEEEMESLRLTKATLSRKLEQREEAAKESEQRQRRAETGREEAVAERVAIQAKLERLEALVEKVTSENQTLLAKEAKLQGASDGAAEVNRSMQVMLETYEKENAALMVDLNSVRDHLAAVEGRRREEQDEADRARSRAAAAERRLNERSSEAAQREEALQTRVDSLQRDHEADAAAWRAERESLTRELELVVGQLAVVSVSGKMDKAGNATSEKTHVQSERAQSETQNTQTFYSVEGGSEHCGSVSLGDGVLDNTPVSGSGAGGDFGSVTHTNGPADDKEDLKAQLMALKLSLMQPSGASAGGTPSLSFKTSFSQARRTATASSSGYLQAHRPPVDGASTPSTCSDDDDDGSMHLDERLGAARSSISKAKASLKQLVRQS